MGNNFFKKNRKETRNYDNEKMKQFKTCSFVLDYPLVNKIYDNVFGNIKIYKNIKNKLIISFCNSFDKENLFIKNWFFMNDRSSLKHSNIIKIVDFKFNKKISSKNNLKMDIFCEYLGKDLNSEILYRKLINKRFTSKEIYKIAKSVIKGLDYLNQNSISLGFILKLKLINFNKDLNIKINDIIFEELDIFGIYVSPDINIDFWHKINTNNEFLNANLNKISKLNSFILGLICIELGTFSNIKKLYFMGKFNNETFKVIKNHFDEIYKDNPKLIKLVDNMACLKYDKRKSISDLKEIIIQDKLKKLTLEKKVFIEETKKFQPNNSIFNIN